MQEPNNGPSSLPTIIAGILSILILVAVGVLVSFRWDDATDLDLNEIGDFGAGITSALAFIWLIAAHYQQQAELRQNRDALMLQANELHHQVEASIQQSTLMKESADVQRKQRRPVFRQNSGPHRDASKANIVTQLDFENIGGAATIDSVASHHQYFEIRSQHNRLIDFREKSYFKVDCNQNARVSDFEFTVTFTDRVGDSGKCRFLFKDSENMFVELDSES
tara:strand:- start:356 stop:1021 length:666 start_codon:yes stop_codon:yes gene_type:complete